MLVYVLTGWVGVSMPAVRNLIWFSEAQGVFLLVDCRVGMHSDRRNGDSISPNITISCMKTIAVPFLCSSEAEPPV